MAAMTSGGGPSGGGQMPMMGQGHAGQGGGMQGGQPQQMIMTPGSGGPTTMMPSSGGSSGYHQSTAGHGPAGSAPGMASTTSSYQTTSVTVIPKSQLCKKCNKQPANPGRSWCQSCYVSNKS